MGSFLSNTFFKSFSSTVNILISIFMIQILNSQNFSDIGRNYLLGNRKKIAKFLMRTFTCRSTLLYGSNHKVLICPLVGIGTPPPL
jgi:hypothetical protein